MDSIQDTTGPEKLLRWPLKKKKAHTMRKI